MGFDGDRIGAEVHIRMEAERAMLLDWLQSLQRPRSMRAGGDEAGRFAELVEATRPLVGAVHAYLDLLAPEQAELSADEHASDLRSTLASLWGLLDDRRGPDAEPEIREHLSSLEEAMAAGPDAPARSSRARRVLQFATV